MLPLDELIDNLDRVRRQQLCGYTGGDPCDCKFGANARRHEQTGCPEVRQAIEILRGQHEQAIRDAVAEEVEAYWPGDNLTDEARRLRGVVLKDIARMIRESSTIKVLTPGPDRRARFGAVLTSDERQDEP